MRLARRTLAAIALTTALSATVRAEDAPGVSATEIKVGQTMPYSGPASSYATIARAEAAWFQTVNDQGGVNGRKITLISLDDGYSPPKTVEQTRKLVEQERVALIFQSLGTPTSVAVRKYLNARKVPQLFIAAGTTFWGDYKAWPYSMGWQPTYETESALYAKYLLKNKPNAKIALLAQSDDSGKDYMGSFKRALGDDAKRMVVSDATYEVTDPTLDSQLVAAKEAGADTFYLHANPKFAAIAIKRVSDLDWHPTFFLTSTGSSIAAAIQPAGFERAQGIITMTYLKDPADETWANDEAIKDFLAWMAKYYPQGNPNDSGTFYGYTAAQTMVQVLKQCGNDLSRENIMRQAEKLNLELPMLLPGSRVVTSPTDHYPIETVRMARFQGERWKLMDE